MPQSSESINDMLVYLIIDQCFTKYEIARLIKTKTYKMDHKNFTEKQCGRIEKIYWRIKNYEDQLKFYQNEISSNREEPIDE